MTTIFFRWKMESMKFPLISKECVTPKKCFELGSIFHSFLCNIPVHCVQCVYSDSKQRSQTLWMWQMAACKNLETILWREFEIWIMIIKNCSQTHQTLPEQLQRKNSPLNIYQPEQGLENTQHVFSRIQGKTVAKPSQAKLLRVCAIAIMTAHAPG